MVSQTRLIVGAILGLVIGIMLGVQFGFLAGFASFGVVAVGFLIVTDPERIRREQHLRKITEEAGADELGRERVRQQFLRQREREENIRRDPTGGAFDPSNSIFLRGRGKRR